MQNLWYMDKFSHKKHALLLSLPPRGAWIEIRLLYNGDTSFRQSLPPRGAWIEISQITIRNKLGIVAPPAGSVD